VPDRTEANDIVARDAILKPRLHISPGIGWINDPNGPLFHDGRYHLYYQYNPAEAVHQDIRWGHATSTDLVSWQAEPVAIHPSTEWDRDGVYSGMTISDGDDVVAFFSGSRKNLRYQPVLRAVSQDGGYAFGQAQQVVPEPEAELGVDEYRDPFVWHDGRVWKMLVGASLLDNVGAALLYESSDQLDWKAQGVFASGRAKDTYLASGVDAGNMWEVPQYVVVDGVPGLLVSAFRRGTGPMRVFVLTGKPGEASFGTAACRYLDDGPDFFAASVLTEPGGRVLVWGWGRESLRVPPPAATWSGLLTFPRELRRRTDGHLGSWPVSELDRLRGRELGTISAGRTVTGVPRAFELAATLTAGDDPTDLSLTFDGDGLGISVRYSPADRTVVVDPIGGYDAATIRVPGDEHEIRLRWFFDHSVSELFVSGGGVATHRVYPPVSGSFTMAAARGQIHATVWELRVPQPSSTVHRLDEAPVAG
jgi:beta-fructofuranosidase